MLLSVLALALAVDVASQLHLIGVTGGGQACPISEKYAITASHVLRPHLDSNEQKNENGLRDFRFSSDDGNWGFAKGLGVVYSSDLGAVLSSTKLRFYTVAKAAPEMGDKLYLAGYDWRGREQAYMTRVWESEFLREVAGHLVFKNPGEPGASGSCIWNAAGEVVGIYEGWIGLKNESTVGIATSIWGPWMPEMPSE